VKVIGCKYANTDSLYKATKLLWSIELNDGRVIEFDEWRDWEDSRVEEYGIIGLDSWPETEALLEPVIDLVENEDYTDYTECELKDLLHWEDLEIFNEWVEGGCRPNLSSF
jgi:hypothetical protein